jgi:hypothetical protein
VALSFGYYFQNFKIESIISSIVTLNIATPELQYFLKFLLTYIFCIKYFLTFLGQVNITSSDSFVPVSGKVFGCLWLSLAGLVSLKSLRELRLITVYIGTARKVEIIAVNAIL